MPIDYGPLGNENQLRAAQARQAARKEEKAKVPFRSKTEEATMRVSRAISKGSLLTAAMTSLAVPIGPFIALPPAILGAAMYGIQKIAESRFGKSIDLSKKKMIFEHAGSFSEERIEKNVKRGVIDRKTGDLLISMREVMKEIAPKQNEINRLKGNNSWYNEKLEKLNRKSREINVDIGKEMGPKGSNMELEFLMQDLKPITAKIKSYKKEIELNNSKIDRLSKEVEEIKGSYSEKVLEFEDVRKEKISDKNEKKLDKKLIELKGNIHKKYQEKGKISEQFFNDKYGAYVKKCEIANRVPIDKQEFILDYYRRKGIILP